MTSSIGRWVSGANFFDRDAELHILEQRVRDGNHVLLTGAFFSLWTSYPYSSSECCARLTAPRGSRAS